MSENPYQSPATDFCAAPVASLFRVDGKHLVVRSGAVLPPVCVKSNQPVSQKDVKSKLFTWCSPLVALFLLLGGLLVILGYFIFRKQCTLAYGLSPEVRRKYRNRIFFKLAATVVLFLSLPVLSAVDSSPLIVVAMFLFVASFIWLFVGNAPLTVTNHRKGEFWISGCSQEFLAGLQSTPGWYAGATPFS